MSQPHFMIKDKRSKIFCGCVITKFVGNNILLNYNHSMAIFIT